MAENGIGISVRRKEDKHFLIGKGNYTGDNLACCAGRCLSN